MLRGLRPDTVGAAAPKDSDLVIETETLRARERDIQNLYDFSRRLAACFTVSELISAIENYLSAFGQWVTVITGGIFVVCVLAFRRGIVGEIMAWWSQRRR